MDGLWRTIPQKYGWFFKGTVGYHPILGNLPLKSKITGSLEVSSSTISQARISRWWSKSQVTRSDVCLWTVWRCLRVSPYQWFISSLLAENKWNARCIALIPAASANGRTPSEGKKTTGKCSLATVMMATIRTLFTCTKKKVKNCHPHKWNIKCWHPIINCG